MATKAKKAKTKKIAASKKQTKLQLATQEIESLENTNKLASAIIYYLLKDKNDGSYEDDFKTVYHRYLSKEFDTKLVDGFEWELDRDILEQQNVVAGCKRSIVKELLQPETSPVVIK